ncbi:uncharacterized protein LOC134453625 [Engraulis encrasicolus]|uniref:uncharacterized protein LOC134453625 n=1 Tax=Engraulis encrasicolus TaxID=184585 RepID=UPI002FCF84C6
MSLKCGATCVRWVVFFGLFIPTFGQRRCTKGCSDVMVAASLGSTATLPCSFDENSTGPVLWSKGEDLVRITDPQRVVFLSHKMGRVVVFPNLSLRGNFSIILNRLQSPDMGQYCCERGRLCRTVHIKEAPEPTEKTHQDGTRDTTEVNGVKYNIPTGIYIIIAATVILIAFIVACFCMLKKKWICVQKTEYIIDDKANTSTTIATVHSTVASAPPHPHGPQLTQHNNLQARGDSSANNLQGRHKVKRNNPQQQGGNAPGPTPHALTHFHKNNDVQRGAVTVHRVESVVYENDNHDPGRQQSGASHSHSQTDNRFPQSRTSHVSQPNYANQSEINKSQQPDKAAQKRGVSFQLQNPIYGNSTEFLNDIN